MIVEKYIRSLLYEHDCVVIPDFGGFIAHYMSASVHPIRHTFVPPSKEIAFNEMLKLNDGMLISHIASGEGISREEAAQKVRDFVESVREGIHRNQKYVFEEIGTLSLNFERNLQFAPFAHFNYLSESFGLPELLHKPIDRVPVLPKFRLKDRPATAVPAHAIKPVTLGDTPPVVFREAPKTRYRRGLLYALGIPAVFGMSALVGYLWFTDNDKETASLNPFHSYIEGRTQEEDSLGDVDTSYVLNTSTIAGIENAQQEPTEAPALPEPEPPVAEAVSTPPVSEEATKPSVEPEKNASQRVEAKAADTEITATKTAAPKAAAPEKVVAPEIITEGNAAPRYYVIVGGFGVKGNAFKLKKQLHKKGYSEAVVIRPEGKGLHKVSAIHFDQAEAAAAKASELKGEYGSVWVFKFYGLKIICAHFSF